MRTQPRRATINAPQVAPQSHGLSEVSHATSAQRGAARHVLIASSDEYDRRRSSRLVQFSFKLDARKPIQVDIEHEATRRVQIRTFDKGVDSKEGLNVEPMDLEKPFEGLQDATVIIEDED